MRCHQWHFPCSVQHLIIAKHGLHVCLEGMQGGEDKTHDWDSARGRAGARMETVSLTRTLSLCHGLWHPPVLKWMRQSGTSSKPKLNKIYTWIFMTLEITIETICYLSRFCYFPLSYLRYVRNHVFKVKSWHQSAWAPPHRDTAQRTEVKRKVF